MTQEKPLIVLVTSGYHLYREYLLRMVGRAARVWLFSDAPPTWEHPHIAGSTVVDTGDPAAMVARALELERRTAISGVLCWDEIKIVHAARIAQALRLPGGDPEAVGRCRDKRRTRLALDAAGVGQPRSVLVGGADEARSAAERIGYPVVLKPRALGASLGVALVTEASALEAGFALARAAREEGVPYFDEGVLVEEYVDGPEISVDCMIRDGVTTPLFLARKVTGFAPYFEEVGHSVDACDPLLRDPALLDLLQQAHHAVGYRNGMTHTEVRLTVHGPRLIEINARLGGDLIPYVGFLATGIDPGRVAVEIACGVAPELARSEPAVAAVRFLYPDYDCVVEDVTVDDGPRADGVHTVVALASPGQELLLPPRDNVACRYGYVLARASTLEGCESALDAAGATARLRIRQPALEAA
jgi:predicted ATP-grasp superfamily ATP-dependent carboligase